MFYSSIKKEHEMFDFALVKVLTLSDDGYDIRPDTPLCVDYMFYVSNQSIYVYRGSYSGELRTQNSKSHLMRTQSLKVLPLKHEVGQYLSLIHI